MTQYDKPATGEYVRQNICCGGYDVMVVVRNGDNVVALTSVSGICGGYRPVPYKTEDCLDWDRLVDGKSKVYETPEYDPPVYFKRPVLAFEFFWQEVFYKFVDASWVEIDKAQALALAPGLADYL